MVQPSDSGTDPDLRIWTLADSSDTRHETTDQNGTQPQGGAAAPDPAAYGLSPPLFQPLTAYAARGRIFPAPSAREPRTPVNQSVNETRRYRLRRERCRPPQMTTCRTLTEVRCHNGDWPRRRRLLPDAS